MTVSAWLIATEGWLQEQLQLDAASCSVRPDGRPKPECGDIFVAIHGADKSPGPSNDQDVGVDITVGLTVTVTYRTAYINDNELDQVYAKQSLAIEALCDRIITLIHKQYGLMGAANNLISGTTQLFIEPLRWLGGDAEPTKVGNEWFNPTAPEQGGWVGMVMSNRFGQARRLIGTVQL